MRFSKTTLAAIAGGLTATTLGLSAPASAQPSPPPPPPPMLAAEAPNPYAPPPPGVAPPPARPMAGEPVPSWAPRKPAEFWLGEPVVWHSGWGGRWGVWKNGAFIHLSKNPVTAGG
ncbi:hypothetical protein AU190_16875 [Mycolicibacterium acapulense]|uniref:Uncharacterized protein n=1 Tax=Mycobacterium lehmannii TaxID=2048550 RepID=A0A101AE76_9MYCO|nr:hypothetical protein [Mycobacterium lehmannii]KUI01501.1 hypothetical protein AU189_12430 [Mycolicibacterium acapulense]KUI03466.1 hypothetical protein AU190_16875 [Mycolicibacterium acapulense]KUI13804.1 hypothetical protein AU191_08535 [Mycolicibacterium acapulense]KUI21371.1 hypothetical protein AU192_11235 [Mycobacterium lehmannii]